MKMQDIDELVRTGESTTIEFKKSSANLKSAAETLCAFLNAQGGTVLLGVSDNKKILGQNVTDQTKQEIANTLRKFEPTANIETDYIEVTSNKHLIVLTANPDSRSTPYIFDGKAYERKESSTHQMSQSKYQQLLLSRNLKPVSWEAQPVVGFPIEALDSHEILNTLKDITHKKRLESAIDCHDIMSILTRLKLIESNHVTNAAIVLFAKEIPGNYLQCVLRMARFRGIEKGTFIDSKHVFGNTFQLLKEAEFFINRNSSIASHFETGNMTRIDEPEYPFEAVREALINAICHRDYASLGGAITLTIYDDRIEIANTGMLPPDITLADLKTTHTSHPRNPRITNVFFRRGFIEAMGMGTEQIIKSCAVAKMREPDFCEHAGTFIVKLWSRHFKANIADLTLSNRQKNIISLLKNKPLAPREILALLPEQITDRTLRNDLRFLKQKEWVQSAGKGRQTKWFSIKNTETRK